MSPLERDLVAALSSPVEFGRRLPGYQGDEEGRKQFGPLHEEGAAFLRAHPRASLVWPRNHAKTTLFDQIEAAWTLVRERGHSRILLASATLALAKQNAGKVREILEGDIILDGRRLPIARLWPWAAPVNARNSVGPCGSFNIRGRKGPGKEPSVFTGAPGANLAGSRPTKAILDDVVNEQNSRTREQRERAIEFLAQVEALMYNAASPISMVSTPWAPGDLTDHVASRRGWRQMRRPLYTGPPDPATGLRPTVCPSFINSEEAAEMERVAREAGRYAFFSAQYLLEPMSGDQPLFTAEMWSHAQSRGITARSLPAGPDFLLWDPVARVEGGAGLDRNGIVVIRAIPAQLLPWSVPDPRRNVFAVLFANEIAGGADDALREIEDWVSQKRWPNLKSIWIEEVVAQTFLAPWARQRGRLGGVVVRGQKIPRQDLTLRLAGIQTAIREGYLVIPADCEGAALLRKRLLEFPVSDYDDVPAALALLSSHIERFGRLPGDEGNPVIATPWHLRANLSTDHGSEGVII